MKKSLVTMLAVPLVIILPIIYFGQNSNSVKGEPGKWPDYAIWQRNVQTETGSSPVPTVTIVFSGLMVFHKLKDGYEIGILRVDGHTYKITGVEKLLDTNERKDIKVEWPEQSEQKRYYDWQFEVANPAKQGMSTYLGDPFDRIKDDFRWIVDLEGKDFYGRSLQLKTEALPNLLYPVLHIRNGEIYTRKKTVPLIRRKSSGLFENFGGIAVEIAIDIWLADGGSVSLKAAGKPGEVFRVAKAARSNSTFEIHIDNTPNPDVRSNSLRMNRPGHFENYYKLFSDNLEKFEFQVPPETRDPDPYRCGATLLGTRVDPLR